MRRSSIDIDANGVCVRTHTFSLNPLPLLTLLCVYARLVLQSHAGKVVAALLVAGLGKKSRRQLCDELVSGGIASNDKSDLDAWAMKMGVSTNQQTLPSTPTNQ